MFRVQRKKLSTKRTIDHLVAMGWLDGCVWSYDWYAVCCYCFWGPLTPAIRRLEENVQIGSRWAGRNCAILDLDAADLGPRLLIA